MMNKKNTTEHFDDRVLVKTWQQGNERSFCQLFNRYFRTNYRYVNALIRDRFIAEEIAMDVMFSVWRRKEYIDSRVSILPFMLKTARNKAIDYMRRKKPEMLPLGESDRPHHLSPVFNADFYIRSKEADKIYEQVLLTLAPKRKLAFRMSREGNMPYAEIAKHMQLSRNTVENHIALALKDFRNHFRNTSFCDFPGN